MGRFIVCCGWSPWVLASCAGQPCFPFERCIAPLTLDDLSSCPDTGVCPEVAQ
jgi:hypothetical protein